MKLSHFTISVFLTTKPCAQKKSTLWLMRISIAVFFSIPVIASAGTTEAVIKSFSEVQSGTLLIPYEEGTGYVRAPLLDTQVNIGVQGMLSRTTVSQTFTNDSSDWIEAIYVFPLPDNASVDKLTMVIDGKRIVGEIQPRKKAKQIYQKAKNAGKKASLLEQQRANLFTTRLANIPPGETIEIDIAYQANVKFSDGQFELYYPLTITPRYIPGTPLSYDPEEIEASSGEGWSVPTTQVLDADQITPPMTDNPASVSIAVTLDTGLNNVSVNSSTHNIITTLDSDHNIQNVSLANSSIAADRDFKLSWTPPPSQAPVAAVFRQDTQQLDQTNSYASLMLMPPQEIFSGTTPREVIFVMDTSSSMSGTSIIQARQTLTMGIERLTDTDLFNVIEFDSDTETLFKQPVYANATNKAQAIDWVKGLVADQGTEIMGAMRAALKKTNNTEESSDRIRQIIFVTDGSVGNEDEIFRYLQRNIGNNRLFTVGIGSAPNMWFMRKAAELGRGTYTTIANTSELSEKALQLLIKLERPALTNLQVTFETNNKPEVFPTILPDVYMGEPVLADARWKDKLTQGHMVISGQYAGNNWTQKLKLNPITEQSNANNGTKGLNKLWAHRKIQSLEDQLLFGTSAEQTETAITQVALEHSLVTRYTSLVAVEDIISRDPSTTPSKKALVPQAMPHGNSMLFPQGSLGTKGRFLLSLLLALLSIVFALTTLRVTKYDHTQGPV